MVIGNIFAIAKRRKDEVMAKDSLRKSSRTSKQTANALAKNQIKQGNATLAVAPLGRSIIFIAIGLIVSLWAFASLVR
ncbi:MAG: hypothetical protein U0R17_07050 [Acidimicrobiia bacterium]